MRVLVLAAALLAGVATAQTPPADPGKPESIGKKIDTMPADVRGLEAIEPVYTKLKGWKTSTEGIKDFEQLPKLAQEYLRFLEKESGAKTGMVSTGPDREQTMLLPDFAAALDGLHA